MKLKLTTWQRFQCIQAVGDLRGNVAILHLGGKLLDILNFTDEEKELVGYMQINPSQTMWSGSHEFDIEIKDGNQIDLFKRALQSYGGWPVISLDQVFDLMEQAGVEVSK